MLQTDAWPSKQADEISKSEKLAGDVQGIASHPAWNCDDSQSKAEPPVDSGVANVCKLRRQFDWALEKVGIEYKGVRHECVGTAPACPATADEPVASPNKCIIAYSERKKYGLYCLVSQGCQVVAS